MVKLVEERLAAWQPLAARRDITFVLDHTDAEALIAQIDPALIGSALDAVLDNAIKFSLDGGEVGVRIRAEEKSVLVDVVDGGVGVTDEELTRIGDRFWRGARHQNIEGSGLGLSIARQLIALNAGSMTFGHHEPTGFAVVVRLPGEGRSAVGEREG